MLLSSLVKLLPLLSGVLASDVITLTKDNFDAEVFNHDLSLVEFYAPWCGHCKNLAPEYEEAATTLKEKGIKLAKVDCTEQEAICQTYGVQGYPTLKVFRGADPVEYNGPRKADGIVSYMNKQNLPAISDLTADSHDEFTKADKVVVIAYGDDKHPVPKAFEDYANKNRDSFLFGKFEGSTPPAVAGKPKLPALLVYTSHSDKPTVYNDKFDKADSEEINTFVRTYSLPIFAELGPDNFASYAEASVPIAFLFEDPAEEDRRSKIIKDLEKVTEKLRGVYNFVWIDGIKFGDYAKALGAKEEALPAFVIQDMASQAKYVLNEVATATGIEKFVNGIQDGSIKPFMKSEEVPETQGAVYKLVGTEWEKFFGQKDKDLFVEFYAPWCGHCQRLAPVWESLGEKYTGSNVVIAQMDATENDIPIEAPFKVQSFPTIKFRAAGSDEFVDYEGDRSLESLVEFIEENGKAAPSEAKRDVKEEEAEKEEAKVEEDDEDEDEKEAPGHDEL